MKKNIRAGMAQPMSTRHRRIPVSFKTTNDPSDLLHFSSPSSEELAARCRAVRADGSVICTPEHFIECTPPAETAYGTASVCAVEGMPFTHAVRITCTDVPLNSGAFIVRSRATPEAVPGAGVDPRRKMLLILYMRTLSGGDSDGIGAVQLQIEHPKSYSKSLTATAAAGAEWTRMYFPFSGVQDATSIGIRGGLYRQTVEIGGVEILDFGTDYDSARLPLTSLSVPELLPDAPWRADAFRRIEEIRKGDFTVIVRGRDGKPVEGAQVRFDMFEHEFQFGNAFGPAIVRNETYREKYEMLFNTGVVEHSMKWGPYEENPDGARKQTESAAACGIRYLRGHCLFWERELGSGGKNHLTPAYMFTEEMQKPENRALFNEKCRAHVRQLCRDFRGRCVDWDVINEIISHTKFRDVFGWEIYRDQFAWARAEADEGTLLYYNDYLQFDPRYIPTVEKLIELGTDFDGLGIQAHYDGAQHLPSAQIRLYDSLRRFGKRLKITEYSCSVADENLQANYTRDTLIAAFAEAQMDGFLYWGFWDGANFAAHSPFFDRDWRLKPAGEQYIDLVYNKWWTRGAAAVTDSDGKARIRGFYGDYDVTVSVNGADTSVTCAYHKGYENVLEICLP